MQLDEARSMHQSARQAEAASLQKEQEVTQQVPPPVTLDLGLGCMV